MARPTTPDPLYHHYKRARNVLRRFEPTSVIRQMVDALHKVHLGGTDVIRYYQPWNILLALKWTFQESDGVAHRRHPATLDDVHHVLNILHDMDGDMLPSDYTHLNLFMRRLAFQQFWLHRPDGSALARQEILFGQLPVNHLFRTRFIELTGVSIPDFLDLGFALLALQLQENPPRSFQRSIFSNIEPRLRPGSLDGFLHHLAKTINELHEWLSESSIRTTPVADQLVLPSPLLRVPLLRINSHYIVYYPPVLFRALEESVYRTLRVDGAEDFTQRFGPIFERYVERCLVDTGLMYTPEAKLKATLPGTGKCIDFVIVEDDCNILIDAKCVEMSPLGRVSHQAETVYRAIKESGIKAIVQGLETTLRIELAPPEEQWGRSENFLLIVTFDYLFLGCSSELAAVFGDHLVGSLKRRFGEKLPFPLENVFFLSIREFEDLLERVRAGTTTMLRTLRHAKSADSDPRTRKFHFRQHLDALGEPADRLPFITDALKQLQQRCIDRLPPEMRGFAE